MNKSLEYQELINDQGISRRSIYRGKMLKCSLLPVILLILNVFHVRAFSQPSLRILTINVWSGLDYLGVWKMGEYEPAERRELRFRLLLDQLRTLKPDLILLQEINPASVYARRLADSLSYDEIHQVCNAGIKVGPVGLPTNFKEGIAILARPSLNLQRFDVWKLSGSPGVYGDALTIHFDQSIFALVGRLTVGETSLFIVDAHLVAALPLDSMLQRSFHEYLENRMVSSPEYEGALQRWHDDARRQTREVLELEERLSELPPEVPVVLAGDFNATLESPPLKDLCTEVSYFAVPSSDSLWTWDPPANGNIAYSTKTIDARGDTLSPYGLLCALYDATPRKIDHIFLSPHFKVNDAARCFVAMDSSVTGVYASDHFGLAADVPVPMTVERSLNAGSSLITTNESTIEPLPILSYDTDTGLGYGAKAFLLNLLGGNESFDCVFFNSSKGERWYRLVFSLPDFELRQGKIYPLAVDLVLDYDKWIKNSFFGLGNRSRFQDREYYTREPLEITLSLSKGFSPRLVGQAGIRLKSVRNFNFSDSSTLVHLPPSMNSATASYRSLYISARYDSRNSFVNPSYGSVVQVDAERTLSTSPEDFQFTRLSLSMQDYSVLFYPTTVLAVRWTAQGLIGGNLPVHALASVGGNNTLRGSPQDRYLDKISAIVNAEFRFPLYWRFGGVVGFDAGKVWNSPSELDLVRWATNPNIGLRFYMDTFVVRLDVGLGKETTGMYFNFGQIF